MIGKRVLVVTGGLGVLGLAVADAATQAGWQAIIVDQGQTRAAFAGTVPIMGGIDLTEPAITANAFTQIASHFGKIDALVNAAGGFHWETLADGTPRSWDDQFQINLMTAVVACSAALPHFATHGGSIVNIGALSALSGAAGMGAYAAAKSGVHRLTESLAAELAPAGINVNAVLPATIDTAANRTAMPDADRSSWIAPAALADVILFLISPAARALRGVLLPVSGGVMHEAGNTNTGANHSG